MNPELLAAFRAFLPSLIRHALTAAGFSVAKLGDDTISQLAGGVIACIGLWMSWKNSQAVSAATKDQSQQPPKAG